MPISRLILFVGLLFAAAPLLVEVFEPRGSGGFALHQLTAISGHIVGVVLASSFLAQLAGILSRAYRRHKLNILLHLAVIAAVAVGTWWLMGR